MNLTIPPGVIGAISALQEYYWGGSHYFVVNG